MQCKQIACYFFNFRFCGLESCFRKEKKKVTWKSHWMLDKMQERKTVWFDWNEKIANQNKNFFLVHFFLSLYLSCSIERNCYLNHAITAFIVTTVECYSKRSVVKWKRKSLDEMSVCLFWHDIPNWLFIHHFFFAQSMFIFHIYRRKNMARKSWIHIRYHLCRAGVKRERERKTSVLFFIDALQEKVLKRIIHTVKEVCNGFCDAKFRFAFLTMKVKKLLWILAWTLCESVRY